MIPINEQDFSRLADAVRRRHRATCLPAAVESLERHSYRVMRFVDDLAEGESVNAIDYSVLRAAAILHDVAASKARPESASEASAALAAEMVTACGSDDTYATAVFDTVRLHDGEPEDLETCPQMLMHDACLLARVDEGDASASGFLATRTARRIASELLTPSPARIG